MLPLMRLILLIPIRVILNFLNWLVDNLTIRNKKREIIRKSPLEYLDLKSLVDKHLKVFNIELPTAG